jgi:hypothetical protein
MDQRYPAPCVGSKGCGVIFIELKYFEEDIIGESVNHRLVYETLDQSAVVVDTGIVTAKIQTVRLSFTRAFFLWTYKMSVIMHPSHHGSFRAAIVQIRSSSGAGNYTRAS